VACFVVVVVAVIAVFLGQKQQMAVLMNGCHLQTSQQLVFDNLVQHFLICVVKKKMEIE